MPETETDTVLIAQKVIFLCENRPVTGRDIVDAAIFRGELETEWKYLLRLLAAERRADEQNLEFDDDAIDTAAEQFRYQHDLITAEETEQWLAQRGLTLGEFSAYFVRNYWGNKWDDVEAEPLDYFSAPNDTRKMLVDELLLSGELDRMAERFSRRISSKCEFGDAPADAAAIAAERAAFLERSGIGEEELPGWLEKVGRDREWLEEALAMEAIYRKSQGALLSQQARERQLSALRLPLTRFEVETIELDSLDAAREALLCAREDGMSMEEVAAEGRYPVPASGSPARAGAGGFAAEISQRAPGRYPRADRARRWVSSLPDHRQGGTRPERSGGAGTGRPMHSRPAFFRSHDPLHPMAALVGLTT